jgi:hypothetical protein
MFRFSCCDPDSQNAAESDGTKLLAHPLTANGIGLSNRNVVLRALLREPIRRHPEHIKRRLSVSFSLWKHATTHRSLKKKTAIHNGAGQRNVMSPRIERSNSMVEPATEVTFNLQRKLSRSVITRGGMTANYFSRVRKAFFMDQSMMTIVRQWEKGEINGREVTKRACAIQPDGLMRMHSGGGDNPLFTQFVEKNGAKPLTVFYEVQIRFMISTILPPTVPPSHIPPSHLRKSSAVPPSSFFLGTLYSRSSTIIELYSHAARSRSPGRRVDHLP